MRGTVLVIGGVEIVDRGLFVDPQELTVGSNKSAVEYAARKPFKVFLFQGTQKPGADFGRLRNLSQGYPSGLPLAPQPVSECAHAVIIPVFHSAG